MEILENGFQLDTPPGTFPLSTDSILLAHFANLPKNAKVLDLGSGCGTLGLLLCAKDDGCTVTGIELQEQSHQIALKNIQRNHLSHRITSICTDLRNFAQQDIPDRFDICISNPPYFSGGPASRQTPCARRNDHCTAENLMKTASSALKYGGDFYLVQKPENLAHLCACAGAFHLEAKRLCLVRHRPGHAVSIILLQFRKGGKPGLKWEEWTLFHDDGTPTEIYRTIYHI